MIDDKMGKASLRDILCALQLWIGSGRSHRFVNVSDVRWGDVGYDRSSRGSDESEVPFVVIETTKPVFALTAQQAIDAKVRVVFSLGDAISKYFFGAWWDATPDDIKTDPTAFFFPAAGADGFEWHTQQPRSEMDDMVRDCGYALGLVHNDEHARTFTSKSLRTGIAAEVARDFRVTVTAVNKLHGRSEASRQDCTTYCPPEVLTEPGLLYSDVAAIQAQFDTALSAAFVPIRYDILCTACGYPYCACHKCYKPKTGRGNVHTCWLGVRGVGRKSKNWIAEDEEQFEDRWKAWADLGVDDPPLFVGGCFQFGT
jgi:hypothetical protein